MPNAWRGRDVSASQSKCCQVVFEDRKEQMLMTSTTENLALPITLFREGEIRGPKSLAALFITD